MLEWTGSGYLSLESWMFWKGADAVVQRDPHWTPRARSPCVRAPPSSQGLTFVLSELRVGGRNSHSVLPIRPGPNSSWRGRRTSWRPSSCLHSRKACSQGRKWGEGFVRQLQRQVQTALAKRQELKSEILFWGYVRFAVGSSSSFLW